MSEIGSVPPWKVSWPARTQPWLWLGLLLVLALLLRVGLAHREPVFPDSSTYLSISRSILAGELSTTFREGTPTYLPPVYPLITALFSFVTADMETAAALVASISGGLVVVPIFFFARSLYGQPAGWIAAGLTALNPVLIKWSTHMLTESLFILVYVAGAALGWLAVNTQRRRLFFVAGSVCALAYLTRLVGITLLPVLLLWTMLLVVRRRANLQQTAACAAALALGFLLLAAPYWIYVHERLGYWALAPYYGSIVQTVTTDGSTEQREGASGKFGVNLSTYSDALSKTLSVTLILSLLALFPGHPSTGSLYLITVMVPYFAAILAWLSVPLPSEHIRYISPLIPFFLVLAAGGTVGLARRVARGRLVVVPVTLVVILISFAAQLAYVPGLAFPETWEHRSPSRDKAFGLWIKEHVSPPLTIMARFPHVPYYADAVWFMTPPTLNDVIRLAETRQVDYLVIDRGVDSWMRPQLAFLLEPQRAPEQLELVAAQTVEKGPVVIALYRIKR